MADLKAGDVVHLKSGGPRMTISGRMSALGELTCLWFEGKTRHSGVFGPDALVLAKTQAEDGDF